MPDEPHGRSCAGCQILTLRTAIEEVLALPYPRLGAHMILRAALDLAPSPVDYEYRAVMRHPLYDPDVDQSDAIVPIPATFESPWTDEETARLIAADFGPAASPWIERRRPAGPTERIA